MNSAFLLSYIIWNVSSEIVEIPFIEFPLRWYGVLWAMGLILSQQIMYYIFKMEGKPVKDVDKLTVYIILSALLGARLGHFLFYDPSVFFTDSLQIILPPYAGLASHGGAIGILIGLGLFASNTKYNYVWTVDRLIIVVALTGAFIRFGNLMNSEIIGKPTHVPWAFIFTAVDNTPRHAAQLYEAIYCLLLFVFLFFLWKNKKSTLNNGLLFGLFLIILFSLRFIDEFFKENQEAFENNLPLNMGQLLSIPFVLAGIIFVIYSIRQRKTLVR